MLITCMHAVSRAHVTPWWTTPRPSATRSASLCRQHWAPWRRSHAKRTAPPLQQVAPARTTRHSLSSSCSSSSSSGAESTDFSGRGRERERERKRDRDEKLQEKRVRKGRGWCPGLYASYKTLTSDEKYEALLKTQRLFFFFGTTEWSSCQTFTLPETHLVKFWQSLWRQCQTYCRNIYRDEPWTQETESVQDMISHSSSQSLLP